jgi:hypothetical protein
VLVLRNVTLVMSAAEERSDRRVVVVSGGFNSLSVSFFNLDASVQKQDPQHKQLKKL